MSFLQRTVGPIDPVSAGVLPWGQDNLSMLGLEPLCIQTDYD